MGILVLSNTPLVRASLASLLGAVFTIYNQQFKVVTTDYIIDGGSIIVSLEPYTEPTESEVTTNE